MASKILLISTNRCTSPDPVFPLGLACINGALLRAGHQTDWIDFQVDSEERLHEVLVSFQPDFVGVSLRNIDDVLIRKQETHFKDSISICRLIRQKSSCPIIMGGSGFSIFPTSLLELTGADYGICGEGETSIVALIDALEKGGDCTGVPGLVHRRDGKIAVNSFCLSAMNQQSGFSERPERIIPHYLETSGMLNLQTQRGCSFGCCFCAYPLIEGRPHRRRAPEAIAEEMSQLERLGAKYLVFVDSVFNSSPTHVAETCEAILHANVKLPWTCFLRPRGLTPELMKLMARAGLTHIEFGSDSFCDSVLQDYGKDFTFDDILYSSNLARAENLDYCHFLISGGPGETWDTMQAGFENSRRLLGPVIMAVVGMRIYPGTPLWKRAMKEGRIDEHTDLLEPTYYLASGLTTDGIFERLHTYSQLCTGWVPGDPPPAFTSLVRRLRQRGVQGPLWSYFARTQRLWPQTTN